MGLQKLLMLLLVLLLVSCQDKQFSEAEFLIKKAELLMDSKPDSSLILLQQVPKAESLDGELQARYCLLMMQAKDKNNLYVVSDSLISVAADYYLQSNDSLRKAQSLYYLGRVFEERKENDKAINCFLQSLHTLGDIENNGLSGLLHSHLGNLYLNGKLYKEALEAHQKSRHYTELENDTIGIALSLRDIGFTYMLNNQVDSMQYYYDKALTTAQMSGNNKIISAILSELGYSYVKQNKQEKAIEFVLKSIELEPDSLDLYPSYLMLGYIYSNLKQYSQAEYWLQKSISGPNKETKQEAHRMLYWQEKQLANHQKALDHLEHYNLLYEEIEKQRREENILEIQQKYESEQLKNIAQEAENRTLKNQIFSLTVITILLLLIVALWRVYLYTKKKNERELNNIQKLLDKNYKDLEAYRIELYRSEEKEEQLLEQLAENEKDISENQKKNTEKHARLMQFNKKLLTEMELLQMSQRENEKKSAAILKENTHLQLQIKQKEVNKKEPLLVLIQQLKCNPSHIKSESDWDLLRQFENLFYNSFVDKLDEYLNLTQREKEVCYLVRLGLNNPDIATVLCIDPLSVTKYKTRAKEKITYQSKSTKTLEIILQSL